MACQLPFLVPLPTGASCACCVGLLQLSCAVPPAGVEQGAALGEAGAAGHTTGHHHEGGWEPGQAHCWQQVLVYGGRGLLLQQHHHSNTLYHSWNILGFLSSFFFPVPQYSPGLVGRKPGKVLGDRERKRTKERKPREYVADIARQAYLILFPFTTQCCTSYGSLAAVLHITTASQFVCAHFTNLCVVAAQLLLLNVTAHDG